MNVATEPWIGVAHIKPRPGNGIIGQAIGAFVPTLALAADEEDFIAKVIAKFDSYECEVLEVDEIETCLARFQGAPGDHMEALIMSLDHNHSIVLDDFRAYFSERDDGDA